MGTSMWLQVAEQTQISKWHLVVMWAMNINTAPGCSRTMHPDMTLGVTMAHGHQHGIRRQYQFKIPQDLLAPEVQRVGIGDKDKR